MSKFLYTQEDKELEILPEYHYNDEVILHWYGKNKLGFIKGIHFSKSQKKFKYNVLCEDDKIYVDILVDSGKNFYISKKFTHIFNKSKNKVSQT